MLIIFMEEGQSIMNKKTVSLKSLQIVIIICVFLVLYLDHKVLKDTINIKEKNSILVFMNQLENSYLKFKEKNIDEKLQKLETELTKKREKYNKLNEAVNSYKKERTKWSSKIEELEKE